MIEVNEYFDGDVKSLSLQTATLPATVGVMMPGEYTFNTGEPEKITVVSGEMSVKLPDSDSFTTYASGDSFDVAGKASFDLRLTMQVAYLCLYG